MSERYYPYVPWDDVPIGPSTVVHPNITEDYISHAVISSSTINREGIYGPLAQIFKYLTAQDNKILIADTRIIGTLEVA